MSRLDELIAELCPNGVVVKKLCEVSYMQRGTSLTKAKAVEGDIPVISGGKVPAFYCNSSNRDGETITVAGSGAGAGYVQYWDILFLQMIASLLKEMNLQKQNIYITL